MGKVIQIFLLLVLVWDKLSLAFDCNAKTQNLVSDFFDQNSLSMGTAYLCCPKTDLWEFQKFLLKNRLRVKIFDLESYDLDVKDFQSSYSSLGVVVDLSCNRSDLLIENASYWNLFNISYRWLVFDEENISQETFQNQFLRLDSHVWIVTQGSKFWSVQEMYNPGIYQGGSLQRNDLGFWGFKSGFHFIKNETTFLARNSFGVTLKILAWDLFPIKTDLLDVVTYEEIEKNGNFRFHLDLIEKFGQLYNFTFSLSTISNSEYINNGTSNTLIKALLSNEFDGIASGIFLQTNQIPYLDILSIPSWKIKSHFFFRHPKTSSGNIFLSPMENSVWFVTLLSLILMMVLLRIIIWYEKYYFKVEGYEQPNDASFGYLLLLTFGTITQQASNQISLLPSGRLVTCVLNLFSLMFFQFYSASIVANLLMTAPKTIETLKDLSDSILDVGVADNSYLLDLFQSTTDPIELELYNKKIKGEGNRPEQTFSLEQGIEKLENGSFAFHMVDTSFFRTVTEIWSDKEICEISSIPIRSPQQLYIPLPKNSSFLQFWNVGLLKMTERGILSRNVRFWSVEKPDCLEETTIADYIVSMGDIYSSFVVLGAGIVLGWVIFIMEIIFYLHTNRFKSRLMKHQGKI